MTRVMMTIGMFCLACFSCASGVQALIGSAWLPPRLGSTDQGTMEFSGQLVLINPISGNFIALGDENSTLMINPQTGSFDAVGENASALLGTGTTELTGVMALMDSNTGNFIAFSMDGVTLINPQTSSFVAYGEETTTFGPFVQGGVLQTPTGGFGSFNGGRVEKVAIPDGPTLMAFHPMNASGEFGYPLIVELFPTSSAVIE